MPESHRPSSPSIPPSITDGEIRLQLLRSSLSEVPFLGQVLELDTFAMRASRDGDQAMLILFVRALLEQDSAKLVEIHRLATDTAPFIERLLRHADDERVSDSVPAEVDPPLGTRKFLASRPARASVERHLFDSDPRVIERILRNPMLKESDVVRIVTAPRASAPVLRIVARSSWLRREPVRRALVLGSRTPLALSVPILPLTGLRTLDEVASTTRSAELGFVAREWINDRHASA